MNFVSLNFGTEEKPKNIDLPFKVPSMKVKNALSVIETGLAEAYQSATAGKELSDENANSMSKIVENVTLTNEIEAKRDLTIIEQIKVIANISKLDEASVDKFNSPADGDFWQMQNIIQLTEAVRDFLLPLNKTTLALWKS